MTKNIVIGGKTARTFIKEIEPFVSKAMSSQADQGRGRT